MATRESIMVALQARLTASGVFNLVGRRNRDPNNIASPNTPALFLLEHFEEYRRPSPNMPPIRTFEVRALIYFSVGNDEKAVPSAVVNNILDGVDAALKPDSPEGFCTLGGLVYSANIEGEIVKSAGDTTGKGVAVVPIRIVMP